MVVAHVPVPPPYSYVQADAVANLGEYLGLQATQVRRIVIVGAWHGEEIGELLDRYPAASIIALEPSRDAFGALSGRWGSDPRVRCVPVAAADKDGTMPFHEMSVTGNGSLLALAEPGEGTWRAPGMVQTAAYEVPTVRLDALAELADGEPIDCLWIDVQGFEGAVLRGAERLLDRVGAAFLEVTVNQRTYANATTFDELQGLLGAHGFQLVSLGTHPQIGQGNALWVRRSKRA
jgi:FkbM family methyltransferase